MKRIAVNPTAFNKLIATLSLVATLLLVFCSSSRVWASDHRESPTADANAQGDITDIMAFIDPNDTTKLVLVMNVNPFAVPAETGYVFSTKILYQFKFAGGATAVETNVIQVTFQSVATATCASGQIVNVYGPAAPVKTGHVNVLSSSEPMVKGCTNTTLNSNGIQVFTGLRDDPFVADIGQLNRILQSEQDLFRDFPGFALGALRGRTVRSDGTSGVDGFGGFNVTSIILELPKTMVEGSGAGFLGSSGLVGFWGTTSLPETVTNKIPIPAEIGPKTPSTFAEEAAASRRAGGSVLGIFGSCNQQLGCGQEYLQFQRVGQQLFKTIFVPSSMRESFNASEPVNDPVAYAGLIPDTLTTTDNDGTGNTIAGRAALLTQLGFTDASGTSPGTGHGAPLLLPGTFNNTNVNLLRVALLPDVERINLNILPTGNILPGAAAAGGNGDPWLALGAFGTANGRRPADTVADILLQLARQLADVNFPASTGVPGSGPARPGALNFATDRRVLAVLPGTDFIKPDAQVGNVSGNVAPYGGNDEPLLSVFPFLAAPQPLPGQPSTVGFPVQQ